MPQYEYKVVPAPVKGTKAKGVKTPQGRFANSVQTILNEMGAQGWEYQRAELLPSEERQGLTGSVTNWRNVLVFRRLRPGDISQFQPEILDVAAPAPVAQSPKVAAPSPISEDADEPRLANGAERMLKDNGVEEISDVSGMTTALKSRAARQDDNDTPDTADDGGIEGGTRG